MELTWPLIGRAAELERATTLLQANRGAIVLAGPAGVGKTRLATECLGIAAARGYVPLRVAATQGAAGIPFGAFASLVPDLAPSTDLLEVLRQIARAVSGRGEGKPVAVFVDDAHLLDESSAALTHLLATTEQTFVLATLRPGLGSCPLEGWAGRATRDPSPAHPRGREAPRRRVGRAGRRSHRALPPKANGR